jgi:hypothetical protein
MSFFTKILRRKKQTRGEIRRLRISRLNKKLQGLKISFDNDFRDGAPIDLLLDESSKIKSLRSKIERLDKKLVSN